MKMQRLFFLLIALSLLAAIVLTVQEAAAISKVIAGNGYVPECVGLPSRHSIHARYIAGVDARVTYSEEGPTGVDGGLIQLFSDYRTCSK